MNYEEITNILREKHFRSVADIELYFSQFDFVCDVDCCQWDDVSYIFTSPSTDAYFTVYVDPYSSCFSIYVHKNEDETYCYISYKVTIEEQRIAFE